MHLFILYLQPLITRLEGICCDQDDLVNAYADDISVVTTSPDKIERVRELFEAFGSVSGARLNVDKTNALDVGIVSASTIVSVPWLHTVQWLRLLGILFSNNIRDDMGQNWDIVIQHFRSLVWLHRMRDLNLVQKVYLLNTFLLPKLWYVASVCGARALDIAKVTSIIGSFLWHGTGGIRIPLHQLALPRKRGGLNLHIPAVTVNVLLTNRYLAERECLAIGEPHIIRAGNPPDLSSIPTTYPCLRNVIKQLAYVPPEYGQRPSSRLLRRMLTSRLPDAKIVRETRQHSWRRIWRNVNCPALSSLQRSTLFLLVNGKIPTCDLLFRMGRIVTNSCLFCPFVETLEH